MNNAQQSLRIHASAEGDLSFTDSDWPGLELTGLQPVLRVDDKPVEFHACLAEDGTVEYRGDGVSIRMQCVDRGGDGWEVHSRLRTDRHGVLSHVELLAGDRAAFGPNLDDVRVMIVDRYSGDIISLAEQKSRRLHVSEPNELESKECASSISSEQVMVVYDRTAGRAMLAGFLDSERWLGYVNLQTVHPEQVLRMSIGFDGGDLHMEPGEDLVLGSLLIMTGSAPWALLERYGDITARRHGVTRQAPPVSWCSWYPYRLGVTEDRILAEATIAADRLLPLGLSIIEVDLGWEREHLPHVFEPNEQFPHGLRWLADRLESMGFQMGVWKAPYSISEYDSIPREHPEWLIQDADGIPFATSTWHWPPNGNVYILDLTHPGAQQWLRERIAELHAAGVKYFKADFLSMASHSAAKRRHDNRMVAGSGSESPRKGAAIIKEELSDAWILNCGGPQAPGTGHWPLQYICNDTGNTGLMSWDFMRNIFRTVACHLWQNQRWGIIQPSCLCVGLPGTLEEARLRATMAFWAGGQIDISDTLTTLGEDRWQVLTATLPPLGISAKPIDLFEPIYNYQASDYGALCRGQHTDLVQAEHTPGSVWHLRIEQPWDSWHMVACFALHGLSDDQDPMPTNFTIPLERLGLDPADTYWTYEFWSGQFLGPAPSWRKNPEGYAHPGDWQDMLTPGPDGSLSLSFTSPGVKLFALRNIRTYPWIVGTSFHQSCGTELSDVTWDQSRNELRGRLHRPAGEQGWIIVTGAGRELASARQNGTELRTLPAAHGAWKVLLTGASEGDQWMCRFT